jgi:transcriptional regulator with XRE-family HTH domain
MTTAEKLRKARTEIGFSQEYVAKNLNMNRATVAQIELGNRKVTTDEAAQFCRLYHISSDYLLGTENIETKASMYARGFEELTEADQQEILNLIAFKKAMSKK